MPIMAISRLVLVTGATGYVGSSLVPRLLQNGYSLRVIARDPSKLKGKKWLSKVEVVQGDALEPGSLAVAMSEVETAYYLIHSMTSGADFVEMDRAAARNFGRIAKEAGVEHIIYLGGLGDPNTRLSEHLRSRQQTGAVLRESGVCTTELRAAIIVGAGSASFEMVRYLTERLPVMICPRWVFSRVQPIHIDDALEYLVAALENKPARGEIIQIGGADVLTYAAMMKVYARVRGLRRVLLPVPVLTPNLSSYWVHWVTPVPASFAHPLIGGLRNEVIVQDKSAFRVFPEIGAKFYEDSVRQALQEPENRWFEDRTQEYSFCTRRTRMLRVRNHRGMIIDQYRCPVETSSSEVYRIFSSLGGSNGWLAFNWLWKFRALFDRFIGGVGMRGRRGDSEELHVGQIIDFFKIDQLEIGKLARFRVEMKLPGKAWLQFETRDLEHKRSQLVLTVFYEPKGLAGLLYWYVFYLPHHLIFSAMIKEIASRAEKLSD